MTRIALFADEPMVAAGFRAALSQAVGFELIAVWSTLADLAAIAFQDSVDIILVSMPMEKAFEVLKEIMPHMAHQNFVLWVRDLSNEAKFQAMALGVRGVLRKTLSIELQIETLRRVAAGENCLQKELEANLPAVQRVVLTERENLVIRLLLKGQKNKEIAGSLGINEADVKTCLHRVSKKLGVKGRLNIAQICASIIQPS